MPNLRTCTACGAKRPTAELLHLRAEGQTLRPARLTRPQGRGAWVCLRHACLHRLEQQPARAARSLKGPVRDSDELVSWARQAVLHQIRSALISCVRSGLTSPADGSKHAGPAAAPMAILYAEPAPTQIKALEAPLTDGLQRFDLPWSRATLGVTMGRGPCHSVLVWPGRPSRRLIRHLHQLVEVG